MVPGLTERAAHAAERQSRDWLAAALREQTRRDPVSMPSRAGYRYRLATLRVLLCGRLAVGRRGAGELPRTLSSRLRAEHETATEAVASPDALFAAPFPTEATR